MLFIRHDGIGDVLMSTPLLRAISKARPNIAIDVTYDTFTNDHGYEYTDWAAVERFAAEVAPILRGG